METSVSQVTKFNKSFSGIDTIAFIILPGCTPIAIGNLTTISYSMYRNKKPVINLGRTNINGVTRGTRIYAGTMVFTLINQHWIEELASNDNCKNWLGNVKELKADELPLFDIMIVSANEYGAWCSMFIYGIDLTDEGQTISVEDLFTENVFQFVARDLSVFKSKEPTDLVSNRESGIKYINSNISNTRFYIADDFGADINDIDRYIREKVENESENRERANREKIALARNLYESSSNTFIGSDVLEVQVLLNKNGYTVNTTGVFDHETSIAVRQYQADNGFNANGVVDTRLYNSLLVDSDLVTENKRLDGYVVNKSGTRLFREPDMGSDLLDIYPYKSNIQIMDLVTGEDGMEYYVTDRGYVIADDVFNSFSGHEIIEIPKLSFNDSSFYISLVKEELNKIYPEANLEYTSVFDEETEKYVKRIQEENNRIVTGVIDNDTWLLIQQISKNLTNKTINDGVTFEFGILPSEINTTLSQVNSLLSSELTTNISSKNLLNVKMSAVSKYSDKDYRYRSNLVQVQGDNNHINFYSFLNSFMYEPTIGKTPESVELTIYPYNMTPYKWIVNIER